MRFKPHSLIRPIKKSLAVLVISFSLIIVSRRYPERSEAESKDPARRHAELASTRLRAWPRAESFRGCVAASPALDVTRMFSSLVRRLETRRAGCLRRARLHQAQRRLARADIGQT